MKRRRNKFNEFCEPYRGSSDYIINGLKRAGRGNNVLHYSNGLASAPVIYVPRMAPDIEFKFKLISGFMGVLQDTKTNELYPMVGWLLCEQTAQNEEALEKMQKPSGKDQSLIVDNTNEKEKWMPPKKKRKLNSNVKNGGAI